MINLENKETQFILQAVQRAAQLVKKIQTSIKSEALNKEDRSPVTVADFASQALVGRLLEEYFPSDTLVAEEDASSLRQVENKNILDKVTHFVGSEFPSASAEDVCEWIDRGNQPPGSRFWTLDPIDGTKGFLRGDQYAVALALVINGQVQLGALGCPNLTDAHIPDSNSPGSLVVAGRGQGTWTTSLNNPDSFKPLHVSDIENPQEARILRSFETGHTNVDQMRIFSQVLGTHQEPVRMDSQAKYALLASGHAELLLRMLSPTRPDYREKIWDQAAGSLILEEAGGRITDLEGRPLDFTTGRQLLNNQGILASNGKLHNTALKVLRKISLK